MRKLLISAAAFAAAAILCASTAAAAGGSFGAGTGVRGSDLDSVLAYGSGTAVTASGWIFITNGTQHTMIAATCIRHTGGVVLIGGRVIATNAPAGPGWGAVVVLADGSPDRLGFGFEPPPPTPSSLRCAVDPATFPLAPVALGGFVVGGGAR